MRKLFQGFFRYTDEEFKGLWENALFVVDTNVLLSFYKYATKDTYNLCFDILKDLKEKNRLYIPHQVALEYFHNYEGNMYKQHEGFNKLANKLMKFKETANSSISTAKSDYPYITTFDNFNFVLEELEETKKKVKKKLDDEIKSLPDVNEIKENIFDLMDGIIGGPYSQEEINEIEKDGSLRFLHKVPPGWEDGDNPDKQGFRTYGGMRYQQKYGDLIMWHQIMDKAKDVSKPVIFITEEKKEDWWEKDGKSIKRPQPHLIQEFLEVTEHNFYIYRIEKFVENANEYLDAGVPAEQLEKLTTQVENIRKVEENQETNYKRRLNIGQVIPFLSNSEKTTFDEMLQSPTIYFQGKSRKFAHNRTLEWAIETALPRMEAKLQELAYDFDSHNPIIAKNVSHTLNNLPESKAQRALVLLNAIEFTQSQIDFYGGQGY